jgi:parallel beta-helix repeat protein
MSGDRFTRSVQRVALMIPTALVLWGSAAAFGGAEASAATTCAFATSGSTMTLEADCATDSSIAVPDGMTLDGADHTITAVDPAAGHFVGAVVTNGGATANVTNLTVEASGLSDVCDAGGDRLRGIMFAGASGTITNNTVLDINQGASGCQEGNGVEVRNAPFDGTHPNTQTVSVTHNYIDRYQKTGVVANGDVAVTIRNNTIGASATQANLAANSVQLGFGSMGTVRNNSILGNSWCCADAFASAVLLYGSQAPTVTNNQIGGNSDLAIDVEVNGATVSNNTVTDTGPDGFYDIGIGNYGDDTGTTAGVTADAGSNLVDKNKVSGFTTPFDGGPFGSKNHVRGKPSA